MDNPEISFLEKNKISKIFFLEKIGSQKFSCKKWTTQKKNFFLKNWNDRNCFLDASTNAKPRSSSRNPKPYSYASPATGRYRTRLGPTICHKTFCINHQPRKILGCWVIQKEMSTDKNVEILRFFFTKFTIFYETYNYF